MRTIESIDNEIKKLKELKKETCQHDTIVNVESNTDSYFSDEDNNEIKKSRVCIECYKEFDCK